MKEEPGYRCPGDPDAGKDTLVLYFRVAVDADEVKQLIESFGEEIVFDHLYNSFTDKFENQLAKEHFLKTIINYAKSE
jgi:hypothetical protein